MLALGVSENERIELDNDISQFGDNKEDIIRVQNKIREKIKSKGKKLSQSKKKLSLIAATIKVRHV